MGSFLPERGALLCSCAQAGSHPRKGNRGQGQKTRAGEVPCRTAGPLIPRYERQRVFLTDQLLLSTDLVTVTILVSQMPLMIASDIFYNLSTINLYFPKRSHFPLPRGGSWLSWSHRILFTLTAQSSLGHAHLKYRRRRGQLMGDHDQVWSHSGPEWGSHRGKRVEEQGCHLI